MIKRLIQTTWHQYQFGAQKIEHKYPALLHREGDWYVSWCLEMDIASQGKTVGEAVANLKEAVELYLEDEDIPEPAHLCTAQHCAS